MCIEAPESATIVLSSGFVEDGAGRHPTSEGEENVALCISFFELENFFLPFPTCLCGRIVLVSKFVLETEPVC